MFMRARKTEKMLMWEDKYNKWIYLNHNRGWLKNFLNRFVSTGFNINVGLIAGFIGVPFTVASLLFAIDPLRVKNEQETKLKEAFGDNYHPGIFANTVAVNEEMSHLNVFAVSGVFLILVAAISFFIPLFFKKLDTEYAILKYVDQPKEIVKYFKHVPDKLLEEYLIVDKKISELNRSIEKIEDMFEKDEPLDEFLKIELNKQLKDLKNERDFLRVEADRLYRNSVEVMNKFLQADLEKLNKAKEEENNEKALRMLDDLNKKKAS